MYYGKVNNHKAVNVNMNNGGRKFLRGINTFKETEVRNHAAVCRKDEENGKAEFFNFYNRCLGPGFESTLQLIWEGKAI